MVIRHRIGATPILLSACLPLVSTAAAPTVLDEAAAVRLFLERSPRPRAWTATAEADAARARIGTELPNPALSYSVEDAGGTRDEFLLLEQELPVTGELALRRRAAERAADAARQRVAHDRVQSLGGLRLAFYDVLYRQRRVTGLDAGVQRLERTVEDLRAREREGETSGYDRLLAERRLADLRAESSLADGELAAARAVLGGRIGLEAEDAAPVVTGDFTLAPELPSRAEVVERALAQRADLGATVAAVDRAELERRAARRRRFPVPTLSGGWKRVDSAAGADDGFVAALGVSVPLFARGRPEAAAARWRRETLSAEAEALRQEIAAQARSALAAAAASRAAAAAYGVDPAAAGAEAIEQAAEVAYAEGEYGIIELLAAHETVLAADLRSLQLVYRAKRAELDLMRILGEEGTP